MHSNFGRKLKEFLSFAIFIGIIIGIVSLVATFGGQFMKLFGFEYDSTISLVSFFAMSGFIGFIAGIIVKFVAKLLLYIDIANPIMVKLLFITAYTLVSMTAMHIADFFMPTISATSLSICVMALVMAIYSAVNLD